MDGIQTLLNTLQTQFQFCAWLILIDCHQSMSINIVCQKNAFYTITYYPFAYSSSQIQLPHVYAKMLHNLFYMNFK